MSSYISTILGNTFGVHRTPTLKPGWPVHPVASAGDLNPFVLAEEAVQKPDAPESGNRTPEPGTKETTMKTHGRMNVPPEQNKTHPNPDPSAKGIAQPSPEESAGLSGNEGFVPAQRDISVKSHPGMALPESGQPLRTIEIKSHDIQPTQADPPDVRPVQSKKDHADQKELLLNQGDSPVADQTRPLPLKNIRTVIPIADLEHSSTVSPGKSKDEQPAADVKKGTVRSDDPHSVMTLSHHAISHEIQKEVTEIIPSRPVRNPHEFKSDNRSGLVIGTLTVEVTESRPENIPPPPAGERIVIRHDPAGNPFSGNDFSPNIIYGLGQL